MTATIARPHAIDSRWTSALAVQALVAGGLAVLFARDLADMAALWWRVSTYQHCLFIVPIAAWLVWQRRRQVARIDPVGWWPGLGLMLAAGLVWLVGQASEIALFRHAGVIAMLQASVVAVLGPAVARACAFPLFYLVFLVPFGDEFVGPMQLVTARMATALLDLSGIPAVLDGVFITTPAGWFEVAEACAGVEFLVALVAFAAVVAHVGFRTPRRRALFMAAAIVLPVLANGLRAWGTIVAAELTSIEAASGFDHIVYGWFFFAFVSLVLMAGAWRFFDRSVGDGSAGGPIASAPTRSGPVALVAPFVLGVAALPIVWDGAAAARGRVDLPASVDLPAVVGWSRAQAIASPRWSPRFDQADHRLLGRYRDAGGRHVDVGVALYGWQGRGREVVGYGQGAIDRDGGWAQAASLPPVAGGNAVRLIGPDRSERVAATFWLVAGESRRSPTDVKLASFAARLGGGDQSAATLVVSAEGRHAEPTIAAFVASLGSPDDVLRRALAQARGH